MVFDFRCCQRKRLLQANSREEIGMNRSRMGFVTAPRTCSFPWTVLRARLVTSYRARGPTCIRTPSRSREPLKVLALWYESSCSCNADRPAIKGDFEARSAQKWHEARDEPYPDLSAKFHGISSFEAALSSSLDVSLRCSTGPLPQRYSPVISAMDKVELSCCLCRLRLKDRRPRTATMSSRQAFYVN